MRLVKPNIKYKTSWKKAMLEFKKEGLKEGNPNDIEGEIKKRKSYAAGKAGKGLVPASMFWLVDNDKYIGRIDIRHVLNKSLRLNGGHIGYAIRKSKRGEGFGLEILRLGLKKARLIGLKKVMITCDDDNIASQKIIEKHGGRLKNKIIHEGKLTRRYWINIK